MAPDGGPGSALIRTLRYVALGDSYTIGTSVGAASAGPSSSWRDSAARSSSSRTSASTATRRGTSSRTSCRDSTAWHPSSRRSSWASTTSSRVFRRSDSGATPRRSLTPSWRGCRRPDPGRFDARLHGHAAGRVVRRPGPAARRDRHEQRGTSGAGRRRGIAFVDIFDISARADRDRTLVARDGLHPSGVQYGLWVDRIEPVVRGCWPAMLLPVAKAARPAAKPDQLRPVIGPAGGTRVLAVAWPSTKSRRAAWAGRPSIPNSPSGWSVRANQKTWSTPWSMKSR